jgi:multimeric flavodoxin WrbA
MGQMSGQAKTFLDRMSAYIVPKFSPKFNSEYANKKLILVFTQGNPDKNKFKQYFDYTTKMFSLLSFNVKKFILITNTRSQNLCGNKKVEIN